MCWVLGGDDNGDVLTFDPTSYIQHICVVSDPDQKEDFFLQAVPPLSRNQTNNAMVVILYGWSQLLQLCDSKIAHLPLFLSWFQLTGFSAKLIQSLLKHRSLVRIVGQLQRVARWVRTRKLLLPVTKLSLKSRDMVTSATATMQSVGISLWYDTHWDSRSWLLLLQLAPLSCEWLFI